MRKTLSCVCICDGQIKNVCKIEFHKKALTLEIKINSILSHFKRDSKLQQKYSVSLEDYNINNKDLEYQGKNSVG